MNCHHEPWARSLAPTPQDLFIWPKDYQYRFAPGTKAISRENYVLVFPALGLFGSSRGVGSIWSTFGFLNMMSKWISKHGKRWKIKDNDDEDENEKLWWTNRRQIKKITNTKEKNKKNNTKKTITTRTKINDKKRHQQQLAETKKKTIIWPLMVFRGKIRGICLSGDQKKGRGQKQRTRTTSKLEGTEK